MISLLSLVLAALLLIDVPATTPVSPTKTLQSAGQWKVEYSDLGCKLQRPMAAGGDPYLLALAVEPLESRVTLTIEHAEPVRGRDEGDTTIYVDGSQEPLTAHFNFFKSPVRLAVREYLLDYRQHGLGKVKDRLRLQTRKRGDFELRLPKFQLAMRALATCKLDLHRSLGIDDAVLKSMAVKPQGFASTVLDLPAFDDALNFTVLYWVTVEGRVEQCRLLVPSGIKSFDKTICPRIEQKARLTPAKNAQGVPIRAPVYESPKVRRMRI